MWILENAMLEIQERLFKYTVYYLHLHRHVASFLKGGGDLLKKKKTTFQNNENTNPWKGEGVA